MLELLQNYIERGYEIEIRSQQFGGGYIIIKMHNPFTDKWAAQEVWLSDFPKCGSVNGYLTRIFFELRRKVDMV